MISEMLGFKKAQQMNKINFEQKKCSNGLVLNTVKNQVM